MQPGAERAFLFQVAVNLAWHARRSLARRREIFGEQVPETIETRATAEELIKQMQIRRHLGGIVDRMDDSLRAVFTLFAIEEMNLNEIAVFCASRAAPSRRGCDGARAASQNVASVEVAWTRGAKGAKPSDEQVLDNLAEEARRARTRATRAGAWMPTWPTTRSRHFRCSVWPERPHAARRSGIESHGPPVAL